jgi:hypothetical protein
MKIALNIFTNCTTSAPGISIIRQTYISFIKTFSNKYNTKIFMDIHPNIYKADQYHRNLNGYFTKYEVIKTKSLSDGYIQSIMQSDADYLFQLEWDWSFNGIYINHSLENICEMMRINNIYHFRFNKRTNIIAVWDRWLKEKEFNGIKCCESPNLSNNPHIIDRKKYAEEMIKYIKIVPGSKGIERELNATGKYTSIIYGGTNYPATVTHVDGRKGARR